MRPRVSSVASGRAADRASRAPRSRPPRAPSSGGRRSRRRGAPRPPLPVGVARPHADRPRRRSSRRVRAGARARGSAAAISASAATRRWFSILRPKSSRPISVARNSTRRPAEQRIRRIDKPHHAERLGLGLARRSHRPRRASKRDRSFEQGHGAAVRPRVGDARECDPVVPPAPARLPSVRPTAQPRPTRLRGADPAGCFRSARVVISFRPQGVMPS